MKNCGWVHWVVSFSWSQGEEAVAGGEYCVFILNIGEIKCSFRPPRGAGGANRTQKL